MSGEKSLHEVHPEPMRRVSYRKRFSCDSLDSFECRGKRCAATQGMGPVQAAHQLFLHSNPVHVWKECGKWRRAQTPVLDELAKQKENEALRVALDLWK